LICRQLQSKTHATEREKGRGKGRGSGNRRRRERQREEGEGEKQGGVAEESGGAEAGGRSR
jgi:hypothetical protein